MSVVPTAAAQLAIWAKPARRTHCQRRDGLTANGCSNTAARAALPRDPTGTAASFCRAVTSTDAPPWVLGSGLNGARGLGLRLPFCGREGYHREGRTRGASGEEPSPCPTVRGRGGVRGAKPCSGQRLLRSWMLCSLEQLLQVDLKSSHSSWSQPFRREGPDGGQHSPSWQRRPV